MSEGEEKGRDVYTGMIGTLRFDLWGKEEDTSWIGGSK